MKILKMSKWKIALVTVALVAVLAFGGTIAFLAFNTDGVRNVFTSGVVNIEVEEEFNGGDIRNNDVIVKQVRIKNDDAKGELNVVDAYIRVNLVATWVDDDGSVVPVDAESLIDYNLNLDNSSADDVQGSWVLGDDGFYYFNAAVAPNEYTDYLLESVSAKANVVLPETGHLEINVLADAIQASGDAYQDAWGNPTSDNVEIYGK